MKRIIAMGMVAMLMTTVGCVRRSGPTYGYRQGYVQRGHWVHDHGRDYWVEGRR